MSTYTALESGGGAPIELFRFVAGSTIYAYTSSDTAVDYDGDTYLPIEIKRDELQSTSESTRMQLNVGVPVTTDLAKLFVSGAAATAAPVTCTIFRFQRGADLTDPTQIVTIWAGTVAGRALSGPEARLTTTPALRAIEQTIPRYRWQLQCNHSLYSPGCGILKATYALNATVTTITPGSRSLTATLAATAQAPPYYAGGILDFGPFAAFIEGHTASAGDVVTLTLLNWLSTLTVGSAIVLSPGCDLQPGTCKSKFDNFVNFFGFSQGPTTNPYVSGIQ